MKAELSNTENKISNGDKNQLFWENARLLSEEFKIIPLLYGSLGLEYLTGENLNADDVDILIPQVYLSDKWDNFRAVLEDNGYVLVDEHEHTFEKYGVHCSYASMEELKTFADISADEIRTITAEGVDFRVLTLQQYLKVYSASSKDGYRKDVRNKKDAEKIALIRKYLEKEKDENISAAAAEKEKNNVIINALKTAFPYTIPVFTGFIFLGISYGVLMSVSGFPFWVPLLISCVVYGGSLQFAAVAMLLSAFAPVEVFAVAIVVQARHLFYGITMMEKFKGTGWKKFFLIFGMSDETFSINCSAEPPHNIDRPWFMLWVTLLDWLYWVGGTAIGAGIGNFITFNTEGLDFAMTAMFVVIFIEQWLKDKKHWSALIGMIASVLCLVIFGADSFLIPTMLCILLLLGIFRRPIEKAGEGQ